MLARMVSASLAHLPRYASHLRGILRQAQPFGAESESPRQTQVERGITYAFAMLGQTTARLDLPNMSNLSVVDRLGHRRPAYRGLLVSAFLQADALVPGIAPREIDPATYDGLFARLKQIHLPDTRPISASIGDVVAEAAWLALPLHLAGKMHHHADWLGASAAIFDRILHSQTPAGPFLLASHSDNPETNWYHELLILHALSSYAVHSNQLHLRDSIFRNTEYQQSETQPDHATNQPWALFPMLWNVNTVPLADQVLHASLTQNSQTPGALALMLLADALYCVERILN